jgi:hypothetical protein
MALIFEKRDIWNKIPAFISDKIEELMFERAHSGVETTPDETSNLIEVFYKFITRIWIAEALHAERMYPQIFETALGQNLLRFLYDVLLSGRGGTIGLWVSIAREIRNFFLQNNVETFTEGLMSIDFGRTSRDDNPTSRLLNFRNEFAHGAFHAAKEHVQQHYEILADCFENISGIYTQNIVVHKEGVWHQCTQEVFTIEAPIESSEEGVFLLSRDKTSYMRLTGLYTLSNSLLLPVEAKRFSSKELFASELIQGFINRYIKEKNGELYLEDNFNDSSKKIPQKFQQQLISEIKKEHNACLIEAYPGSDVQNILHHHKELGKDFDSYFVWNVERDDLTMSGITFAYKIMHTIDSIIPNIKPKSRREPILDALERFLEALEENNKSIFILLHNLHIGLEEYRREEIVLLDVYQLLIEKNVSISATLYPGQIRKGIFYDSVIVYPQMTKNPEDLKNHVLELTNDPLKKKILNAVKDQELHLFEICDSIDQTYGSAVTFEPEIEYALWDMVSILKTTRKKKSIENEIRNVRIWSLFDPSIMEYIQ